ncbi:MAG: Ribonucleotide reductase of class III (anaerobic), activating protein [Candidatus Bipolaricaulis sibiricus]|uniref:Ribonucleotide reductase of class III (Anaerobic), activating protein n=1 Tax=Bipolaricaulis sibiricus TaxID=2501609 RepID=A0A410FWT1_BIPS1|nr:MAG: Ribonucleotide reductase of class III (anaerobic), activating protein [Candidatus Bipolaricaulis sibiricus]
MRIAHVQPLSLLDYPGKVSAVVWTVGCNLRCPFCYNAELVLPELAGGLPRVPLGAILALLRERVGFLDGVVVTGGEPTLNAELPVFLRELKELGFLVKLDTNGTRPDVLRSLLDDGLVDYVALDVKAPFPRYPEFTGLCVRPVASESVSEGCSISAPVPDCCSVAEDMSDFVARVRESMAVVRDRAPDYEFRTTVAPGIARDDLVAIAGEIRGARRYALQPFFVPAGKRLVNETWRARAALAPDALRALLPALQGPVRTELRA